MASRVVTSRIRECPAHEDLIKAVSSLGTSMKWYNIVGGGLFTVGCAVLVVSIYAIFYAGAIQAQVTHNTIEIEKLESKVNIHLEQPMIHRPYFLNHDQQGSDNG